MEADTRDEVANRLHAQGLIVMSIEEKISSNLKDIGQIQIGGYSLKDRLIVTKQLVAMITAGLPIIRTSPAHGTAFEIAGLGQARSGSFRKALYMACDIYKNRQLFDEISKDPLPQKDLTEFGQ